MRTQIIDPPEGWRFGFPCVYDPKPGQSLADWLREKRYPEKLIPLAERHSRYWEE